MALAYCLSSAGMFTTSTTERKSRRSTRGNLSIGTQSRKLLQIRLLVVLCVFKLLSELWQFLSDSSDALGYRGGVSL